MIKEAPKSIKYGRCFRLKLSNNLRNSKLFLNNFKFGFKAIEYGWLDSKQLNSIIRLIKIEFKKKYLLKLNCSLIIPITKKPLEMRMGKGKGDRKFWKCPVTKGMVILEFGDISEDQVSYIFKIIKNRLPFLIKLVKIIF